MAKRSVEIITLASTSSSDDDTPPVVNRLLNTKTDVKARKTARKSTTASMSQLSIIPIKTERSKTPPSQNFASSAKNSIIGANHSKLNNTSVTQTCHAKKPMHESNNISPLNRSSNSAIEDNFVKPAVNGLPAVEISKKMPHLTITPIPKPSAPPVVHNSRTARKSFSSKSGHHSAPEVQITANTIHKPPAYQNSTKLSEKNQPVRVSPSLSKTAVHPPNSNKVTVNNSSLSNSVNNSCNVSEKRPGHGKDSLYVETQKKKARKSFPSSSSQLPPSLVSSLGKSGVSIIVNKTNSVNSGQTGKKNEEEVFDPKSLKTSPDLSITKVISDKVNITESSNDKTEGRTQVSQKSVAQNSIRQLNTNSSINNCQPSVVKSKVDKTSITNYFPLKNSMVSILKISKNNTQSSSLSRNNIRNNANDSSINKPIQNNNTSKNNSNLRKPQTRARSRNVSVKKDNITSKSMADSESEVFIISDTGQTQSITKKPIKAFPVPKFVPKKNSTPKSIQKVSLSKKSSPLKRKNSNSVPSPKPSKKRSLRAPPNGIFPNSTFEDNHKRIKAIKKSLNDLKNDVKLQEKTDNIVNAASTKKESINPLQHIGEKKEDKAISKSVEENKVIPLPFYEEKKRDTIGKKKEDKTISKSVQEKKVIPLPFYEEKKVIPLPFYEEKKKDTVNSVLCNKKDEVIVLPFYKEIKKDTVRSVPYNQKKDVVVLEVKGPEKKNASTVSLQHVDGKDSSINPLAHVEVQYKIDSTSHVEKGANILVPSDESVPKETQMGGHKSPNVQNLDLNNVATNNGNFEESISGMPLEGPHKQVTSPKLSLKRKTTSTNISSDETPVKKLKNGDASFDITDSQLQNQEKSIAASSSTKTSDVVNSFPWNEDDGISIKYKKFLQFCKPFMKSSPKEENKIVKTFAKLFQKADVQFIGSPNFIDLLQKTALKVKMNPGEIFVHLSCLSSRLKEHKRLDISPSSSSSKERLDNTNHVKQISTDEPEIVSFVSRKELKTSENSNNFEHSVNEEASHLSSKVPEVADNSERNSCNEPERASRLSDDNGKAIDSAKHSKQIPDDVPKITSDLSNFSQSENSRLTSHTGKIANEPEIQSDLSNLNDKSETLESTNPIDAIPTDEPEISNNFDEPGNEENSPSLITSNPVEAMEVNDSPSPSANVINPTIIESSVRCSSMNEFYNKPSTSWQADYAEVLFSSTVPGNTVEEIEEESRKCPLDDLTRESLENHQKRYLKKISNSIPDSQLPIPKALPDIRDSHLEKRNDSDSTASLPDKSIKSNQRTDSSAKGKNKDEEALERRIKKLEKYLGDLDKKIKKLQLEELSLDDLDDDESIYIREDRYKKRFNQVFKRLCQLKKSSSRLGREIERRFTYEGSRYPAINKAIEKLVNKSKAAKIFPNYKETLDKVRQVNELNNIGLTSREEEHEAEQIFKDVGKELQRRRMLDEEQDLISYCPDDVELDYDPADHDEGLKSMLISSAAEGEKKIEEIMQKYVEMQRQEDKVSDNVMEVEETSEDEQEDSDIPETEPASPSTDERIDEVETEAKPPKEDLPAPVSNCEDPELIDLSSSSDASTVPGSIMLERRISDERPSLLSGVPPIIRDEIEVIEDSNFGDNSSPDLPSLQDLLSSI